MLSSSSKYSTNNCNSSSTIANNGPQRKYLKRSRTSVQFSQSVSLRCFFVPQSGVEHAAATSSSLWSKKDDVDKIKSRAKTLAKLHCHIRNKHQSMRNNNNSSSPYGASATIGDITRYQIKGESLRGMEYITDLPDGEKRRRITDEAISAVMIEQHEQLLQQYVLANSGTEVDQVMRRTIEMDTSKMAEAYGAKAREARMYARQVADEDAAIASEILAEDLSSQRASTSASSDNGKISFSYLTKGSSAERKNERSESTSSARPDVAAGIANSFRPDTMPHRRSIVSMQA